MSYSKRGPWFALAILACTLTPSSAQAGPWTRSLGGYYAKLGAGYFTGTGAFRTATTLVTGEDVTYQSFSPSLYAEVGVWDKLALHLYVPLLAARNRFAASGNDYLRVSMGDTLVSLQWTSPWLELPHAVRLELKLPVYDVNSSFDRGEVSAASLGVVNSAENFPAPGDGQLDGTLWVSVGKDLWPKPVYAFVELGYQVRTQVYLSDEPVNGAVPDFKDSIRWDSQLGWKFYSDLLVMASFNGTWPLQQDGANKITKGFMNIGAGTFLPVGKGVALEASYFYQAHENEATIPNAHNVLVGISQSK